MELVDEWSTIDFNNLPSSISEFFNAEEFAKLPGYEKRRLSNLRQNFELLKRAGLPVKPPDFMIKGKSEKERRKICAVPLTDSSEDSDVEWTPASERPRKPAQKRPFQPPFKVGSQNAPERKSEGPQVKGQKGKAKRQKIQESSDEEDDAHVYPFRTKRVTSFMSLRIPDDDDYLYCEECNLEYFGDCPEHGPLKHINDSVVPPTCKRGEDPEYCRKTLPPGLVIKRSKIPQAGLGVFATKFFPVRSRFGPYGGKKETDRMIAYESGYCWQVIRDEKASHFVDASDPKESNWMRFVNCARSEEEQCVTAYQHKGEVYYRAHKDIYPGRELLVYYGDSYAKDLGIRPQSVGGTKASAAVDQGTGVLDAKTPVAVEQGNGVGDAKTFSAIYFQELQQGKDNSGHFQCLWCPNVYSEWIRQENHMKRKHRDEYCNLLQEKFARYIS